MPHDDGVALVVLLQGVAAARNAAVAVCCRLPMMSVALSLAVKIFLLILLSQLSLQLLQAAFTVVEGSEGGDGGG